ncbi:MAG: TolC family protein, partial [Bacteroidales bacterium]|nr:TolC family protein [Bacteroidales bacterium]
AAGKASTLELNQAQEEADSSRQKYIEDVCNFWLYYYTLRKLALYDFIGNRDIDVSFDEMVE